MQCSIFCLGSAQCQSRGPHRIRKTSPTSDEWSQSTCFSRVAATTSARTRRMTVPISTPASPMCLRNAVENGLLRPSPSKATLSARRGRRQHWRAAPSYKSRQRTAVDGQDRNPGRRPNFSCSVSLKLTFWLGHVPTVVLSSERSFRASHAGRPVLLVSLQPFCARVFLSFESCFSPTTGVLRVHH